MKKKSRKNKKDAGGQKYMLPASGYASFQRPKFTFLDPNMFMTMRYAEIISFSIASLGGSNQVMRLNSIFDPNAAVGGTQPYGYDQIAALYNRYRVIKTRWKVTFPASSAGYYVVVVPVNGALSSVVSDQTTFTSAIMVPYAERDVYCLGARAPKFKGKMDLNVLGGVQREEYLADDRFEAQVGANPAEVISLNIGVYNPSAGTIAIPFLVELWYEVDFHDPISLAPS